MTVTITFESQDDADGSQDLVDFLESSGFEVETEVESSDDSNEDS